jgi:hypothetical protein
MSFKDPTIPTALRGDRRRGLIYPSPFFDVAQSYMPPTVKELLKWCAYFFYTDPLIGSVVYKIAEYPVTDFIYSSEDEHVRKQWKHVMEDVLNIKPFLIEIGLDFFTFGNAFISINLPFKRLLECAECNHKADVTDLTYKFKNYLFHYKCPSCEEEVIGKVHDVPVKSIQDINFIRWDPKNIEIEFNPLTGKSRYRYRVPNRIRRAIQQGKKELLNEIPWIFIQAVKENKDIILSLRNLFHFKRPTLAEQDQGWGKPLILHSMKRLFYLYVLRRAQEAIALQRILPLEFIFPQANATQDPYQHVNLHTWSGRIQEEIRKWRTDPNYISVVPVPLGFERLGGDGRALMLGPEIEIANKEITGGMGVPLEFVFGGLSWTGSSVSLRTLENHFLMYRRLLMRFINFVKGHLVSRCGLPNIDLKFTEFKMADDIQRKQMAVQLNAAQKISDETLLTELGWDHAKEQKKIRGQVSKQMELQEMQMKAQAQAQGEAQITSAKYQIQAQEAQIKAQQQMTERLNAEGIQTPEQQQEQQMQEQMQAQQAQAQGQVPPGQQQQGQLPPDQQQQQQQQQQQVDQTQQPMADEEMARQAVAQGMGPAGAPQKKEESQKGLKGQSNVVEFDVDAIAKRWATKLMKMTQAQRNSVLADLQSRMPNMYQVVLQFMGMTPPGGTAADAQMRPLPEKAPPRRKNSPV